MDVVIIKGGQLSLRASVIAHCRALVLMCLFCCKQLFLHFLILMITRRRCGYFGCHSTCFTAFFFPAEHWERERTQTNYGFGNVWP